MLPTLSSLEWLIARVPSFVNLIIIPSSNNNNNNNKTSLLCQMGFKGELPCWVIVLQSLSLLEDFEDKIL